VKILFDQGIPAPLRSFLPNHSVVTAYEKGWSTLKNGDLILAGESEGIEVFVTTDSNLKYQQNLQRRTIAIVVLLSTSWPRIQKRLSAVVAAIEGSSPGSYSEVNI